MYPRVEGSTQPHFKRHLPVFDRARGVAIALVFLFHALAVSFGADHLKWDGWHRVWPGSISFLLLLPAYFGDGGVAVFFVVSGFCIHWSHARSTRKDLRTFFIRRFFRIYPPYLVALLFFVLALPMTRLTFSSAHEVHAFISHLFLFHNNLGIGFLYGINPSFWSIGVEVQLYALYPVLLLLVERWGWKRALLFIGATELALRALVGWVGIESNAAFWIGGQPITYWLSWSLGATLADDFLYDRPLLLRRFPIWFWPALAMGAYFIRPIAGFRFLFCALATTTVLARTITWAPSPSRWTGALQKLGLVSYSFYLLHQPLEALAASATASIFGPHPWIIFAGCLVSAPMIYLIAGIFYRAVERPSIALGREILRWNPLHAPGTPTLAVTDR